MNMIFPIPFPPRWFAILVTACTMAALLGGCLHSDPGGRAQRNSSAPVVKLRMGVAGVNALGKSSLISLDKLVIVFTSSAGDTVRDTVTSSTSPALSTVSTALQTITKNYELPALRSWKVVVASRDVLDSVIHRDSAAIPVLYAGDTAVATLQLSARYSLYEAVFLTLPDSIMSSTGTHKQVLNINRLVLRINDVTIRDSIAEPGPFFAALSSHALDYDYVSHETGSWQAVASGTTQGLYGVAFGAADTGFIFGDNITLKTTDGGGAWTEKNHAPLIIRAGVAVNGFTAYAAGDFGILTYTHTGGEDGAATFQPEPDFPEAADNPAFHGISFPSSSTGYAAGAEGSLWKTTDSSVTWVAQTSGVTQDLHAVHFVDENTGWAAGAGGTILATSNGGANWSPQTSGTGADLNGIRFVSASLGWAVGSGGVILKTVDGGANWSAQTSGTAQSLNALFFLDAATGFAAGENGVIVRTTNGGTDWVVQTTPTSRTLRGIAFFGKTGYVVGDSGTILSLLPGNHLIEMMAFGPLADWDEAQPLFRGSEMINVATGQDSTVALQLNWTGPTTGSGNLEAEIGKVGKVIIDGTVPDTTGF